MAADMMDSDSAVVLVGPRGTLAAGTTIVLGRTSHATFAVTQLPIVCFAMPPLHIVRFALTQIPIVRFALTQIPVVPV